MGARHRRHAPLLTVILIDSLLPCRLRQRPALTHSAGAAYTPRLDTVKNVLWTGPLSHWMVYIQPAPSFEM